MKYSHPISIAALLHAAHHANAQTPPSSQPSCSGDLVINYNGTSTVETDTILFPDQVSTQPTFHLNETVSATHMVLLVDLSISGARYNGTALPLARGLQACRTTRLHYLQTGFTQAEDGTFVSETDAVAPHGGPMPTLNDIPHTFTFYLFPQPDDFALPAWDAGRNLTALGAPDRLNFSVTAISDVVGAPIAANYFRTYNRSNTDSGSFSNGTCPGFLTGNGNGTGVGGGNETGGGSGGSGNSSPAVCTGLGGRVESGLGYLLAAVGGVAFALLCV